MDKVSIVIPVYNEEKFIANSVRSMLNQDYENLEIIVVNNGSTDNTLEQIPKSDKVRVFNTIHQHDTTIVNKNIPNAHRLGIREASGEYIVLFVAHAYAGPHFISTLVSEIENHPEAIAVGAPDVFIVNSPITLKMFFLLWQKFRYPSHDGYIQFVHLSIWRKNKFRDIFGEELWPEGDDIEMNLISHNKGYKKWFTNKTACYNINKYTTKQLFRKMVIYGNGRAFYAKQYHNNLAFYSLLSIPLTVFGYGIGFFLGLFNFDVRRKWGW